MSNRLSNALIHGAHDVVVRVSAQTQGAESRLSVTKQGAPIPPEQQKRQLQPVTRLSEDNGIDALGLGLYIAAEIASAPGGRLGVASTVAATTFTLVIPV